MCVLFSTRTIFFWHGKSCDVRHAGTDLIVTLIYINSCTSHSLLSWLSLTTNTTPNYSFPLVHKVFLATTQFLENISKLSRNIVKYFLHKIKNKYCTIFAETNKYDKYVPSECFPYEMIVPVWSCTLTKFLCHNHYHNIMIVLNRFE